MEKSTLTRVDISNLIAVLVSKIIGLAIKGFVFSKLWLWFIVPIFHIKPLRVFEAIGIILLLNLLSSIVNNKGDNEDKGYSAFESILINELVIPWLILLFGWGVSLFL